MRRAAALLLALAAACSTPPCQELGQRLCGCTGADKDTCKRTVEKQLESVSASDSVCDERLATCKAPSGAVFCEWIHTDAGKVACGLAQPAQP